MVEYLAEIVGFIVVLFVLGRWVVPLLNKGMAQRQEAIRQQLDEAEEAKKRLAVAQEKYDNALAEAQKEAERLQELARQQSDSIVSEMREQAHAEAQRIVEQAHQQIESDHQQTLNELHSVIGRLTAELTGRIVDESLSDGELQRRIIDRFLDGVEDRARVGAR